MSKIPAGWVRTLLVERGGGADLDGERRGTSGSEFGGCAGSEDRC